ncbi:type I restriction endonuclease subunit R, EcoR124 family [Marinomonas transparens]|uniref:Type I restriction enzyme endonuclease subunit n=1 Tax=Marinomonas transparens TaxID=2795388 RepID=A0A934N1S6_9GAMM|nr:HsdR family type I site-specific deoxyribonuclease [Marinomonas transparens]MBJ7538057.1 HsdR family type I site-specific deoxyribonuclease [Marinomonas transparens]
MIREVYGLKYDDFERILAVFSRFPDIESVVLYGSRAKGNYRAGSDIDLTIFIQDGRDVLFSVMEALDDLDLIYGFDVSLYKHIDNDSLKDHIERVGIEIYNAAKNAVIEQEVEQQTRQAETEEAHGHAPIDNYDPAHTQSEAQLEESLISRLTHLGYERVKIGNGDELRANLKRQLEIHNNLELTDAEFAFVLNHLDKGNVFQRAKTLRGRCLVTRENGRDVYVKFLNTDHWCQNEYQVTSQITQQGKYENRYDVTLLINGLPLVQIELKRRGVELKEAFNQINRYQRHSFWSENGLFNYAQLFVISNGVNTKYYANNRDQDFKQTFFWADKDNHLVTKLDAFADAFLEKCHVSKMISKYIVLHESDKLLMVLRPYQYYAAEAIVERVKAGRKNGYIWHTTGSGKTLTSFKAAQLLCDLPKVDKVMFVVDRADLDYQTTREFNHFSEGCVDGTDNTRALVKQMAGLGNKSNKLIVTTIQKLNTAITRSRHEVAMEAVKDQRVIFIFDECHRSQFGDTHKNIKKFFTKAQMFGFTGTPIFAENATANENGKRTTKDLFGERLHQYVITNAIADENVLKFSIEYWGKLKKKDGSLADESVTNINTKAYWEDDKRVNDVVDWVIANHGRKTHNKQFSAMMCVSSKEVLFKYYDAFKRKRLAGEHDLRVVTIFTYGANEEDQDANGLIGEPDFDIKTDSPKAQHSREKLESYVEDYNAQYHTSFSVKDGPSFYTYYKDIAKRMKERDKKNFKDADRADILLVVNMFLTGFDAKKLNTLYVDKNLKYHGLIQAFSRTNRILGDVKSQGNIVCFRNLKDNTDEAIKLFCDTNASEDVLMEPYEFYVEEFNKGLVDVLNLAQTPEAVNDLISEDAQLAFVRSFRHIVRQLNKLNSFTDFAWQDLAIDKQTFEDFKSKYLDIHDRTRKETDEGASIINEVDFELELIQRDEVNVAYILMLLGDIQSKYQQQGRSVDIETATRDVLNMLGNEVQLRSKRELIEKFVAEYMPNLAPEQDLTDTFGGFWQQQKRQAIHALCEKEQMDKTAFYGLIDEYIFTGKPPLRDQLFSLLDYKPKLAERKKVYERIMGEFNDIIETYEENTGLIEGVAELNTDYDTATLANLAHSLGDRALFFSDQVARARSVVPVAAFTLYLDTPYTKELATLNQYQLGSDLLAHGVVNDDILAQYLGVTFRFQSLLAEEGVPFVDASCIAGNNPESSALFWSLSEAREGSTVVEFVLQYWEAVASVGVAGAGVYKFILDYPKLSDGLKRIKADIKTLLPEAKAEKSSMIIVENVEQEFKKLLDDRE